MLLRLLGASLLIIVLTSKGAIGSCEDTIRAGQDY